MSDITWLNILCKFVCIAAGGLTEYHAIYQKFKLSFDEWVKSLISVDSKD